LIEFFFGYTGSEQEGEREREREKMQIATPGRKNSPADSRTKKTRPGKEEAARKKKVSSSLSPSPLALLGA